MFARAEAKATGPWGRLYGRTVADRFGQLTFASEKGFTEEPEVWRSEDVTPFIAGREFLGLSHAQVRAFQRWLDALDREVLDKSEGDESYYLELTLVKLTGDYNDLPA